MAKSHCKISCELGVAASESSQIQDLGAQRINWQIVAASSAESRLSGFLTSMFLTKESMILGAFNDNDGKSDILHRNVLKKKSEGNADQKSKYDRIYL